MPGFDGTGPMGKGPMTGGRLGRCGRRAEKDQPTNTEQAKTETPDAESPVLGVGQGGRPRGGGRGRCWGGGRGRGAR
jgi:hypothetical protein